MDESKYIEVLEKELQELYLNFDVLTHIKREIEEYGYYTIDVKSLLSGPEQQIFILPHRDKSNKRATDIWFHNHNCFELVYVQKGSALNRFKDDEIPLSAGDVLLLNPNILHEIYTDDPNAQLFCIMLMEPLFSGTMMGLLSGNQLISGFLVNYFYQVNTSQDYIYFQYSDNEQILHILDRIICEYVEKQPAYLSAIYSMLVTLFALLARTYLSNKRIVDLKGNSSISKLPEMIDYINKHCATITIPELVQKFNYSSGHISRLIKKHTNMTYAELVQKYKLNHACDALIGTSLPLDDIAKSVGFNDRIYFGKLFKKSYGVSPGKFRNKHNSYSD